MSLVFQKTKRRTQGVVKMPWRSLDQKKAQHRRRLNIRLRHTLSTLLILCGMMAPHVSYAQDQKYCVAIRMNADSDWHPFSFRKDLAMDGAAVVIAKTIMANLGVTIIEQSELPRKRLFNALKTQQTDIIAAAHNSSLTPKGVVLSDSFAQDSVHLFINRYHGPTYSTVSDLEGYQGTRPLGVAFSERFEALSERHLSLKEQSMSMGDYRALVQGLTDYILDFGTKAQAQLRRTGLSDHITMLEEPIETVDIHMALASKAPCTQLLDSINVEIQRLKKDGTIQSITERYRALF